MYFKQFKIIFFYKIRQQNEKADQIQKELVESIYSCCKSLERSRKSRALAKLVTVGMDSESIWQQLELQNEENFQSNLKEVSRFLAVDSGKFKMKLDDMPNDEEDNDDQDDSQSINDDDDEFHVDDEENEEEIDDERQESGFNDNDDEEEDDSENENERVSLNKKKPRKSIVDDKFFKLSEMEEFLIDQDRREMKRNTKSESEDDIDYFGEDNDEINLQESLKYSDFFDPTDNEDYRNKHEDSNQMPDEDEEEEEYEEDVPKSSHELKQERLKKKIESMENDMLEKKSWQMKGEIKGDTRPQNSLLEEVLEFDSTTRPAPIITETVSLQLEDVIRQRIKDKAYDDVERKVKPSDIQYEYKKQIVLDQEKSKQSLAQIYEKEYLKEMEKLDPNAGDVEEEEPKEHKEIRAELKDLFEKLDMLSNFHYTPKAAQPELKIITNLPTISMEEVAPVSVSDATLLAPEEIKTKPKGGYILGEGERTKTDKKRERRHKKEFQKDKFSKQKTGKEALVNKVMKSRNVEKMKSTGDAAKSSSAFFSRLQDEMSLTKKDGKTKVKRKADAQTHQAKKLKL